MSVQPRVPQRTPEEQAALVADGLAAVREWEAENGALTEDELSAARDRALSRRERLARLRGVR